MAEAKKPPARTKSGAAAKAGKAPATQRKGAKKPQNATEKVPKPRKRSPPGIYKPVKFKEMAQKYGVSDNALFLATLETYAIQLAVIESIKRAMKDAGPTVEKSYVQGVSNTYIHPAVKELPRHVDSANKTAALLVSIIKGLGSAPAGGDEDEFTAY